jgi:hypothetical protein
MIRRGDKVIAIVISLSLFLSAATAAFAQEPRLNIDSLSSLQDKASQTVDVTLDQSMLAMATKFLSEKRSENEAAIKQIVSGLKGVYVKSFEFDSEDAYSQQDVEPILAQLKSPAWSRIVGVTCKRKGEKENIQVYLMYANDEVKGLAAVAAGERDLTVINIIGFIDVEKLGSLCGSFGIPKFDLKFGGN